MHEVNGSSLSVPENSLPQLHHLMSYHHHHKLSITTTITTDNVISVGNIFTTVNNIILTIAIDTTNTIYVPATANKQNVSSGVSSMIEPESLSSMLILERIRNRIGVSGNSLIIIINRDMLVEKMLTWIDSADIITFPRVEYK